MSLELSWSNEQEEYVITDDLIHTLEELLRLAGIQENVTDGEVALTFVTDERIRELNKQYRGLDKPTDVLSFAMLEMGEDEIEIIYGDREELDGKDILESDDLRLADLLDSEGKDTSPEAGENAADLEAGAEETEDEGEFFDDFEEPLGDIIISVQRAVAQAEEYGHSVERELGFLFVHGFLHLIGYDHGDEGEEKIMFGKQEQILRQAGLAR